MHSGRITACSNSKTVNPFIGFNILKTLLLVVTTTHLRATRPDTPLFKTGYYAVTACLTPKNQRVMGLMDGPKDQLTDIAGFSVAST